MTVPVHSTDAPIEATTKAVDALLCAIEAAPSSGAVTAYRAAITRHGRSLIDVAGPEALGAVRERVVALVPLHAEDRRATIATAWASLPQEHSA